ncbi:MULTISPECIES: shufflon system plasmid conjugative transfer pilus tip adhesin PilV [Cronobacter]|uniref:shufflon system plasmid conjugative transfer pilus tip adhesin PilV n=1 Tax=Cronobacter TaxID=413496 RepID=UPI000CFEAE0B|nr:MULTISPECIES: shufflon system plasmid conjugative transfer pilus tip adhesin PilV [Cronobacter]EKM0439570.1 shufflon system plasmid conjugative transfer pilus tip adhesin PilV [Cronobacter turicensis]WRU16790.1 shufflon system plasmid conjugative transfer pilus tip adhesin PilV [Cronobacter malonaticus]
MNKMKRGVAQITDATVAMGIGAVLLVILLIPLAQRAVEEYRMNVAAGQANTVLKAVNRYIADYQSTIAAGSSAQSGYVLTVPMLINAGYLPAGYSSTNAYSATYRTLIFQPTANKFHTMTFMTGGAELSLSEARTLANHIGAAGGYIENGVAKGALGSWQENLSAFGGFNPGNGSVVMAGFYSNGALVNDYLYRHSVAGHPELNTMGTTLNMGGNDISNAKIVNTQTLNASGNVNGAHLTASKTIQSKGTINADGNISSQKSITAENDVLAKGNLQSTKDAVIGGVVKLQQINTAGTYCDTWGAISRDSSGAVLSCQDGVWKDGGVGRLVDLGEYQTNKTSWQTVQLPGTHKLCMVSGLMSAGDNGACRLRENNNVWYLEMLGYNGSSTQHCWISCID